MKWKATKLNGAFCDAAVLWNSSCTETAKFTGVKLAPKLQCCPPISCCDELILIYHRMFPTIRQTGILFVICCMLMVTFTCVFRMLISQDFITRYILYILFVLFCVE